MAAEISMDQAFKQKLNDVLEAHFGNEHFGVRELCEVMAVSRSQLHRNIHDLYGKSISRFIREFRLHKAMELLRGNVATASEIAYRVGFSSPTYFNTCFREYYGYPPGEVKFHSSESPIAQSHSSIPEFVSSQVPANHAANKASVSSTAAPLSGASTTDDPSSAFLSIKKRWILWVSAGLMIVLFIAYASDFRFADTQSVESLETIPTDRTIAVLPIKNWTGDPALEYISDGMTDAVISRLSMISSLDHVIPFTSVLKYKASDKSLPIIAKELGVRNILQGNFQLQGDQMKMTLQLVDGPSNHHIWSHEFTGKWNTEEVFAIQADVAEKVAGQMNAKIDSEEIAAIQKIPTENSEAYNAWMLANFQAYKYTEKGFTNAVPLYEKAIALDSTFIEAYVDLAYVQIFAGASWGMLGEQKAWSSAKELLLRASRLDSTHPATKKALTDGSYIYEWDFDRMEREYMKHSTLPVIYSLQTGRFEDVLSMADKKIQKYPAAVFPYVSKAQALFHLNRWQEATAILNTCDRLFDDHIMYLRVATRYYFYMGEYEASRALLDRIMSNFPDRPPVVLWLNALHAHRDGKMLEAGALVSELQQRFSEGASGSPAWFTALYYSAIGDHEHAMGWLQRSYDRHEVELIWLREEPLLVSLRGDPRYKALYRNIGFKQPPYPAKK